MAYINTERAYTFDDVLIRPNESTIEPRDAHTRTALARGFFIPIPVVSAAMDTVTDDTMAIRLGRCGGIGFIHRNQTTEDEVAMVIEAKKAGVKVGAACSPFDVERAQALLCAGVDIVAIDSAHGHNENVIEGAWEIKKLCGNVPVTVGNIATKEAAYRLVDFADAIKVGIGPGSICTTRIVSGVGVPQLSAILEVASVAVPRGVPVIADGGIRTSGDAAKAIAAGASAVMLGSVLAGTDAAPGKIVERNGVMCKIYRGMGSRNVLEEGRANDRYLGKSDVVVPEGVSGEIRYSGTLEEVIQTFVGGIQVSMGYVGARTLAEFSECAEMQLVSPTSINESRPHSLVHFHG
jgi:IMP dehydrogenase